MLLAGEQVQLAALIGYSRLAYPLLGRLQQSLLGIFQSFFFRLVSGYSFLFVLLLFYFDFEAPKTLPEECMGKCSEVSVVIHSRERVSERIHLFHIGFKLRTAIALPIARNHLF